MALKIWKDGAMAKIDTSLHKPVIFLNGTKHKLDKAWVFVNGEKKEIWGESGVQIDYISSTGVLGGGIPFAAGENWLDCYYNNVIYRIDISNLSNPTLIRQVTYGDIQAYNNYQSTQTYKVFSTKHNSSKTNYKLKMDNTTGEISALSSCTITATSSGTNAINSVGITNNNFIDCFSILRSLRPAQIWDRYVYWNNVQKYSAGIFMPYYYFQDGNDTFIGYNNGLKRFSQTGMTDISGSVPSEYYNITTTDFLPRQIFDDGTYVFSCNNTTIYKKEITDLENEVATYTVDDADYKLRLMGQIGNYIYCLRVPSASSINTPDAVIKLILLNSSNLGVAYEKVLPNDPFNEYYGFPTFWGSSRAIPQISGTGFIGFGMYDSSGLKLRVARFSGII